jgi:hypothetical protein
LSTQTVHLASDLNRWRISASSGQGDAPGVSITHAHRHAQRVTVPFPAATGDNRREIIMWILVTILVIAWVAIAFWPARVAGRKGHSFFGYFLLSLVFFPLALILAYVVEDRSALAFG